MSRTKVPLRGRASPKHTAVVTRVALLALLVFVLSAGAAAARGGDHGGGGGDDDITVRGTCGPGASSSLRVRAHEGGIEVRFRLRQTRGRGSWRITIVHENRVAFRVTRRTTRSDDSVALRWILPDLRGNDMVVAHAWGPGGLGCRASATLPDGT
jgi:hypothetical protein